MLQRSIRHLDAYRTKKVSELMTHVYGKKQAQFDHIAVDIGDAAAQAVRMADNEEEMIKFVNRYVFGILMKRVTARKSFAIFFDGSDPLWKLQKTRRNPSKKFGSRFQRSAASQLMYSMEDSLRASALERNVAPEVVIAGPTVPGCFENKFSRWQLDLAARSDVSINDSFLCFGGTDLYLSNFAMTPFHNLTNMTLHSKELKELTTHDVLDWLGVSKLLEDEHRPKLAKVRVDVTFLILMTQGLSCTDVGAGAFQGFTLREALDSYLPIAMEENQFLFQNDEATGELVLDAVVLEKILSKMVKSVPAPQEQPLVADQLEILLQTHTMLCNGGIRDFSFVPRSAEKVVLQLGSVLRHLRSLSGDAKNIRCRVNDQFALTGAELLLVGAPNVLQVEKYLPDFTGGHAIPEEVTKKVIDAEIEGAVTQAREILQAVPAHTHDALKHSPTHCWRRNPGDKGPPAGWTYYSVNLGLRSRAQKTRIAATKTDESMVMSRAPRNSLVSYNAGSKDWEDKQPPFEADYPKQLKVITWNVQFNRHSGETTPLGRPGIDWCSKTRYVALGDVLSKTDADIIAMQESEGPWYDFLSNQQWVKDNYRFSCPRDGDSINPWGILMLVHRRVPVNSFGMTNVPGYTGHASVMPSLKIPVGKGKEISVNSIHLLAPYQKDSDSNRDTQVRNMEKRLDPKHVGQDCVIMGDFNDHNERFYEFPSTMGFRDAWIDLKGRDNLEEGYTIDGKKSKYTSLIIEPEFFGRADRIHFRSTSLTASSIELIGTDPVRKQLGITTCPEYLFPSDHFGISCTVKLVN